MRVTVEPALPQPTPSRSVIARRPDVLVSLLMLLCSLLICGCQPSPATKLPTGKVVAVADGDTVTLLMDGNVQVRVRLHGIDAPERGQPFNRRAKEELSALVFGKVVGIEDHGQDRYGRTIGHVFIDGLDVCERLVEQGMAWHYTQYDDSAALRDAEERARRAKRGLGQDREPVPPWEWRKLDKDERQKRREASELGAE